ncbi:hypothetical protein [Staphylococcus aureus]|uniref:hypothetical protein n=1 Tax=Staphylococcus aureus TaxID=1280 RepID=UPI000F71BE4E|nr:hypothetical protein [Staphylococcus aureus]VEG26833.1 Uncharacterised protein [Staphylococcus aureus]
MNDQIDCLIARLKCVNDTSVVLFYIQNKKIGQMKSENFPSDRLIAESKLV